MCGPYRCFLPSLATAVRSTHQSCFPVSRSTLTGLRRHQFRVVDVGAHLSVQADGGDRAVLQPSGPLAPMTPGVGWLPWPVRCWSEPEPEAESFMANAVPVATTATRAATATAIWSFFFSVLVSQEGSGCCACRNEACVYRGELKA
ncbi:hypothetical protein DVA86_10735 [Streptomyces armeniacus]|uniref:Uncharacterized protein n=1 Tax=Streptomyces armeniacus TaxID=83291 RepID=A0A345XN39_9ACTN|nr:hypothetical protein DVA86_10735 [Streptomyces armeniacus]